MEGGVKNWRRFSTNVCLYFANDTKYGQFQRKTCAMYRMVSFTMTVSDA